MRQKTLALLLLAGWSVTAPGVAWADYLGDARQALQKGDVRAAQIHLRNAVKSDPQNAEAHYQLARVSLELGDAVAAEREAKAARDRGYDAQKVVPVLAQAYLAQNKTREILAEFTPGNRDPQFDAEILVIRGYAQAAQRDLTAAQASFEQARTLAPNSTKPLLAAARLAASRNDLAGALKATDEALALDAKSAELLILKSQLLRAKGDTQGAMEAIEAAVKASPDLMAARLERASAFMALNKTAEAKKDLDAVLAANQNNPQALYLQAVLAAQAKDYQAADAILTRIAPAMQAIPRAYFLQALVKRNLNQGEQAEEAASRYVSRVPDDLQGVKLLAALQLQKRQAAPAIATLNDAARRGHADAQIYDMLAQAYTLAERRDEAVQSLEKAAALAPEDPGMRTRLAAARMGAGDAEKAIADLEKSFALAPAQTGVGAALFFAELSTGDLNGAAAALAKVRAAQGDTPVVRNLEGLLKMTQLDLPAAKAIFEGIVKDTPDFVAARTNLARVALLQGQNAEAEKQLSGILAKEPRSEPALSIYQALELQQGKPADAIAAVERARAADPADPRLTVMLADLYNRNGDAKRALDLLSPAVKPGEDVPLPILAARAQLLALQGKQAEARDTLRAILARDPSALDTRLRLIAALVDAKDYEAARTATQEGLRLAPRNYQLLSAYPAIDAKASGLDAALETAGRLQKQNQDFLPARALAGDVYVDAKRFDDASKSYLAANDAAPSSLFVLRAANAQLQAGKPETAADLLRGWVAKNPNDVDALQLLASIDIGANRMDAAIANLNKVLAKNPRDGVALNNLAWAYQQKNDPRAKAIAEKAYVLLSNPQTADTLGWILATQGDTAKSLMLLRQASLQAPADPNIAYHYAWALNKAGQRAEAVKLLTPVVQGDGNFAEKGDAQKLFNELSRS